MTYDTGSVNALILAGGINRVKLHAGYTPGYKALLQFGGKPSIRFTVETVKRTRAVKRICIVGPVEAIKDALADPGGFEFVRSGVTLIENIRRGLGHFGGSGAVLVIPADLPLATPRAVGDFLDKCARIKTAFEAKILWSMVPEENFSGPYVKEKRKGFNRFRDVSVCHGNLILITPSVLENRRFVSRLESIYNARKSSVSAALAVGPLLGLSYLFGVHLTHCLTLEQFARIASGSFGIGLVPVIVEHPEIAVDLDEAGDYEFIREELERRERQ